MGLEIITTIFNLLAIYGTGYSLHMAQAYFRRYPKDRPLFKAFVAITLAINTFHGCAVASLVCTRYHNAVHGNPNAQSYYSISAMLCFCSISIISMVVQMFYCTRLYLIQQRHLLLPVVTAGLAIAGAAILLCYSIALRVTIDKPVQPTYIRILIIVGVAIQVLIDAIIASAWVSVVWRSRKQGVQTARLNHLIHRILVLILQTNALTALLVITTLIVNLAYPPAYELIPRLIPSCYLCSLLINLTSRSSEDVPAPPRAEMVMIPTNDKLSYGRTSRTFRRQHESFIGQIEITTECETKIDGP